jgi:hypothetical protein
LQIADSFLIGAPGFTAVQFLGRRDARCGKDRAQLIRSVEQIRRTLAGGDCSSDDHFQPERRFVGFFECDANFFVRFLRASAFSFMASTLCTPDATQPARVWA